MKLSPVMNSVLDQVSSSWVAVLDMEPCPSMNTVYALKNRKLIETDWRYTKRCSLGEMFIRKAGNSR